LEGNATLVIKYALLPLKLGAREGERDINRGMRRSEEREGHMTH
jgi:hypothetical protein